jgi:hypothetical protein
MKWIVTLSGNRLDIERLLTESIDVLRPDPGNASQLYVEFEDPEGGAVGEDATRAAEAEINAFVTRLNGIGRLRWGRVFQPLSIAARKTIDEAGHATQRVVLGIAHDHMLPEDYADMVERLGHPRPPMPKGLEIVNGIDFVASMQLAESTPDVARAVHLVDLMLDGDEEIDWIAGYAAIEVIEHDLRGRSLDGRQLGWWSKKEIGDFKATANSPEVLGFSARHGAPTGLREARMTTKEANWFVRRVVATWSTHLLRTRP